MAELSYQMRQLYYEIMKLLYIAIESLLLVAVIVCVGIIASKVYKWYQLPIKMKSKDYAIGIIFGLCGLNTAVYSPINEEGHICVFGGSGSGKTSSILVPSLQKILEKDSSATALVIDISGDINKNVPVTNKIVYTPNDPLSTPYNIFGTIDNIDNPNEKKQALEKLAELFLPDDPKMSDAERYYNSGAKNIFTAVLIGFYDSKDFVEMCELIVWNNYQTLFKLIDETKNVKAISYINNFEGTAETHINGCKQNLDNALMLFANNEVIKPTIRRPIGDEPCYVPEVLENTSVFINMPDSLLQLYAPILHILVAQTMEYFGSRNLNKDNTILFCLDEFASFGRLPILEALQKYRKRHVRLMILTQSLIDIDLIYGKDERKSMMDNFNFISVLSATEPETQEYFSKLCGERTVYNKSYSQGLGKRTHTKTEKQEYAIKPIEFSRLKNKTILIFKGGYMKLRKNYFFKRIC